jgi:hypothetical protein
VECHAATFVSGPPGLFINDGKIEEMMQRIKILEKVFILVDWSCIESCAADLSSIPNTRDKVSSVACADYDIGSGDDEYDDIQEIASNENGAGDSLSVGPCADFLILPSCAWDTIYQRFDGGGVQDEEARGFFKGSFEEAAPCDLRALPLCGWESIHDRFCRGQVQIQRLVDNLQMEQCQFQIDNKVESVSFVQGVSSGEITAECKSEMVEILFNLIWASLQVEDCPESASVTLRKYENGCRTAIRRRLEKMFQVAEDKLKVLFRQSRHAQSESDNLRYILASDMGTEPVVEDAVCTRGEADDELGNDALPQVEIVPWLLHDWNELGCIRATCTKNADLVDECTPFAAMM